MSRAIVSYVATAVVFLALDAVWLSLSASRLYRPLIGDMVLDSFRPAPAVLFYALFVLGIVILAISPAFREGGWRHAMIYGGLFGFFAYATYDLTNQATLKQWSTVVTVADMAWGTFVSGVSATVGFLTASWWVGRSVS